MMKKYFKRVVSKGLSQFRQKQIELTEFRKTLAKVVLSQHSMLN